MTSFPVWKHRFFILLRIASKAAYRIFGSWNINLQPQERFSIKPGYHHASRAESFDDTGSNDEYQRSVYELAGRLALKCNNPSIIDVGCGSGYKLVHMLGQYQTIGIEVEPVYSWLGKKYPGRKWLLYDPGNMDALQANIVICSDVIEHLENPDDMMVTLKNINFNYLILSTPDRESICGKNDYGPPENTAHFREWSTTEFKTYVSRWFTIQEQHIFKDKSITQAVVCSKIK